LPAASPLDQGRARLAGNGQGAGALDNQEGFRLAWHERRKIPQVVGREEREIGARHLQVVHGVARLCANHHRLHAPSLDLLTGEPLGPVADGQHRDERRGAHHHAQRGQHRAKRIGT
jgi:hypothetical protein